MRRSTARAEKKWVKSEDKEGGYEGVRTGKKQRGKWTGGKLREQQEAVRKKKRRGKDNWKRGTARENDETQRGSGQGWMGMKGGRESGRGGGDRSVSVRRSKMKNPNKCL